ALAIGFNWDMLSFVPLMGLNIALMSMIGRTVGAGDMSRTNEVIVAGFVMAVTYSGIMAVIFVMFRTSLLSIFATPGLDFSPILAVGAPMMIGLALYAVADGFILVCSGVLRGAGDTRWLMLASISIHVLALIVQMLVILVWKLGPIMSWSVFVATLIINALLYLWRLLGSRWRHPERLARVMAE
ncbi:MAG: MATE family efflux transporter, partial [Congregibacter sp.]|nr:MATE family efflux transporter [Congregibacter sp.]